MVGARRALRGARTRGHTEPRPGPRSSAVGRRLVGRRRDPRYPILWIRDALVVHAEEELAERVFDPLDVAQREVALVELPFGQPVADDPFHHRAYRLRLLLRERAHRRLGAIREHHDGGLFRARPWA